MSYSDFPSTIEKQQAEIVMVEPEPCCSHEPTADTSKKNMSDKELLRKAVKKAYKAQHLLNEAMKRLETSEKHKNHKHRHSRRHGTGSGVTNSSSSASSGESSSSSSSSCSSDSDGANIDLTGPTAECSKRHHGRKHHHGRRNRRGREHSRLRSRSRCHSRGRSRGHSRGHSRRHSRGHSGGPSRRPWKTCDTQLCQFPRFFRGDSLPTVPPIHPFHHQRSHSKHEPTCSSRLTRRHSRSKSRSYSRDRHDKGHVPKHHKGKTNHKSGKYKNDNHFVKEQCNGKCHALGRRCDPARFSDPSNSRPFTRPQKCDCRSYLCTEGCPRFAYSFPGLTIPDMRPPPRLRHRFVGKGRRSRSHSRENRDRHKHVYQYHPEGDFDYDWIPPFCGEERCHRRRAHSVPDY